MLLYDSDGDVDEAYAVGMCSDYDTCPDSGTSGIAEYGPKTAKGESRFDMRVATTKPGTVGRTAMEQLPNAFEAELKRLASQIIVRLLLAPAASPAKIAVRRQRCVVPIRNMALLFNLFRQLQP